MWPAVDADTAPVGPASGELWRMLRAHAAPAARPCRRCGNGYPIAPACLAACITPIPGDACPRCAQPRTGGACRSLGCVRGWSRIRRADAVLGYKHGDVERLVLAAKRLEGWAVTALGRLLAGWLLDAAGRRRYDVVLPVPFHAAGLQGRPAHPLTSIYLGARPAVWPRVRADDLAPPLLVQTRPRPARWAQSEPARWRSVRGTVALAFPTRLLRGARVLIVDDVLTSGATVSECARVILDEGGAAAVDAVALARQPWRPRR
ncbi:MAG TPA: phosphoribosyltransferase family protein [bacterium]|nr:phosphoribosyltransferase family protein [bacterium]